MKWELSKSARNTLAGLWLLLTFSVSAWWMVRGMSDATAASDPRLYRMFFWEGSFLLVFVTLGGVGLFLANRAAEKQNEEVRRFFSTFTHELKTSLSSLRLQAEILEEDPRNRENENLRRLLRDVVRLELQLENALVLAQADRSKLFLEEISLGKTVQTVSVHWPELRVSVSGDARVQADQRALECILKNLLQNAAVHGKASEVTVKAEAANDHLVIRVRDNGKGFGGDHNELGSKLVRHTTRSGTGVGLYLSRVLAARMNGNLLFARPASGAGLEASLELLGRLA